MHSDRLCGGLFQKCGLKVHAIARQVDPAFIRECLEHLVAKGWPHTPHRETLRGKINGAAIGMHRERVAAALEAIVEAAAENRNAPGINAVLIVLRGIPDRLKDALRLARHWR